VIHDSRLRGGFFIPGHFSRAELRHHGDGRAYRTSEIMKGDQVHTPIRGVALSVCRHEPDDPRDYLHMRDAHVRTWRVGIGSSAVATFVHTGEIAWHSL
jgi:hypothetical protein